jgi:hypothetical protein
MTEKVGHSAQLRTMRKEWIESTKPKPREEEDYEDVEGLEVLRSMEQGQNGGLMSLDKLIIADEMSRTEEGRTEETSPATDKEDEPLFVDDMSDFDMDDIMGSQEPPEAQEPLKQAADTNESPVPTDTSARQDEFEDEMEAMGEMDDMY